jgi:protoporphyrinogen/coproporphyrinogen III oxidase
MKIAILGGGLAGVTAAYELARLREAGAPVDATLFEASGRLGGIIETVHADGFIIECGPDGWVTEKPWARELADTLGLITQPSLDAQRKTYLLSAEKKLIAMPDGMRLMVPTDLSAMDNSALLTAEAKRAYREEPARAAELRASAPEADESVANFVRRHFGDEVTRTFAAPLLAGVFGGDAETLSVRAVMPALVAMEREHGSLIQALAASGAKSTASIFTTLRDGMGALIDAMAAKLNDVRLQTPVTALEKNGVRWRVISGKQIEEFDAVILATPAHATREIFLPLDAVAADLLPREASSAAIVALGFSEEIALPAGFGFLAPRTNSALLACTFTHQKFAGRVPAGGSMLRAFFSGERWMNAGDDELIALAQKDLGEILGALPKPMILPEPKIKIARRMPHSLPQYAVGHLERIAALHARMPRCLRLIGNAYTGVGIPDLIREARRAAHESHTVLKRAET